MARISELGYGRTGAALRIRILRKWVHHYRQNETWFLGVDTHVSSYNKFNKLLISLPYLYIHFHFCRVMVFKYLGKGQTNIFLNPNFAYFVAMKQKIILALKHVPTQKQFQLQYI